MFICGNLLFRWSQMYIFICSLIIAISMEQTEGRDISQRMVLNLTIDFFNFKVYENPNLAAAYGINKYQYLVQEWNAQAFDRRINKSEEFLTRVNEYLANDITNAEDRLTLDIMKHGLTTFLEGSEFMHFTRTMNADLADLKDLLTVSNPVVTVDELSYWQQQVVGYQQVFEDQLALLDEGIRSGLTPPRTACERVLKKHKDAIGESFDGFFAFQPFIDLIGIDNLQSDREYSDSEQKCKDLRERMQQFVQKFEDEYLPMCRDDAHTSATSLQGGDKFYEAALRFHTADSVTPEYAHNLGLKEVERITTDMKQIISNEGFDGSIGEYVEYLLTQPEETFSTSAEMNQGYRDILNDRIRPKLSSEFYEEPGIQLDIVDHPSGSLGRYQAPRRSNNGWEKGKFLYDGTKPRELLKIVMLPLMVHEAVPGHHYQFSHMLSTVSLPDFRRYIDYNHLAQGPFNFPFYTAYIEGWALYAEYLSEQMGIIQTEKERFAKLSMESLRAARLVVDTGLHYYNWTMQRAADYMKENTALSNSSCWAQVERYVRWPGQACSYKFGELKIKEIRSKAEKELEDLFGPAEFHNALLSLGPVPIEILEKEMDKWIESSLPVVSSAVAILWSGVIFLCTPGLIFELLA